MKNLCFNVFYYYYQVPSRGEIFCSSLYYCTRKGSLSLAKVYLSA
jgi:hypothetical protein